MVNQKYKYCKQSTYRKVGAFIMLIFRRFIMAKLTRYRVPEIDGTKLACPSSGGVSITRNLIQSAGTKRSASAKMTGKIVGTKSTIKMSFPPSLTPSEIDTILKKVINKTMFHKFGFTNEKSEWEEITVYFGNYSTDQYGFINGRMMPQSLSFEAVER